MRAPDGLAGRLDDRDGLGTPEIAGTLQAPRTGGYRFDADGADGHLIVQPVEGFALRGRAEGNVPEPFSDVAPALRSADGGSTQPMIVSPPGDGIRLAHGGELEPMIVAGLGSGGPNMGASEHLAPSLRVGPKGVAQGGPGDTVPIVAFRKATKAQSPDDSERWESSEFTDTLSPMTLGATAIVQEPTILRPSGGTGNGTNMSEGVAQPLLAGQTDHVAGVAGEVADDPLLPVGLDGHRYRLTGNGVVSHIARWLGVRLRLEEEGLLP